MNTLNLYTIGTFLCVVVLGLMMRVVLDLAGQRASARIHSRMEAIFDLSRRKRPRGFDKQSKMFDEAMLGTGEEGNVVSRWAKPKLDRLRTVSGSRGIKIVVCAFFGALFIGFLMVRFLPLPSWTMPIWLIGLPISATMKAYGFLVTRFRTRFLAGFSDLIDMIVRAVRAGVPVTQVIASASMESPEPLRSEFKTMADSLALGRELDEVLETAMARIEIADFSFFCVCLMLQRETGGQLGETLENLSGIVRTRKEIRQKTKALTGEARITTKILASLPIIILICMYAVNRDYLMVLFTREAGHKLMTFAFISVVFGIFLIGKLSKLDTSR